MIGKVNEVPIRAQEFEWSIPDFSSVLENSQWIFSPSFSFADSSWEFGIKGEEQQLRITLRKGSPGPPIRLEFSLGLKTLDGKKDTEESYTHIYKEGDVIARNFDYISKSKLLEKRSELFPSDVLTIVCTLKWAKNIDDAMSEKLLDDLKEMMVNEDHSDITVRVKGKNFALHRAILAARNHYFDSMFKTEMREKSTGIVTIEDCEPDIFHSFIQFLYTGKLDNLSEENVCDLYEVADKYQDNQLKEKCLQFMMNSISLDNFCNFTALALSHDENKLLEKLTKYFIYKNKKITQSTEWQIFKKNVLSKYHKPVVEFTLEAFKRVCLIELLSDESENSSDNDSDAKSSDDHSDNIY